jgi:BirA family biotin operon repressor/biotin-[acetyl-CoA-carboxylase] ligase
VLVAEFQSAGRGRLTRSWVAPAGTGIAVSVLLRPTGVPPSRFGWLPLLAGLAVLDAVRALGVAASGLKWPNDCLIGPRQRKVAGILAVTVKSVIAGEYTAPPAHGPITSEICGTTPEARTLR